jgi:hypothetical protein
MVFELFAFFAQTFDLFFGQLRELRIASVGEQLLVLGDVAQNFPVGAISLDGFFECGTLFYECGEAGLIERFRRMRELAFDFVEAFSDDVEAVCEVQLNFSCGFFGFALGFTRSGLFLLTLGDLFALAELVDASGRIDEFLLAREERMARRTDLDRDLRDRRSGCKRAAAGAVHPGLGVPFGVDLLFHSPNIISAAARPPRPSARGRNAGRSS